MPADRTPPQCRQSRPPIVLLDKLERIHSRPGHWLHRKSHDSTQARPSIGKPGPLGAVTIAGQKLKTSPVFDSFWWFAAERKSIDDKRRKGLPRPWTDDPLLRDYRFCNTFRVCDKVTQFIISEVIEKGSQDPVELVFRVVLFNTFTKIGTYKLLRRKLGTIAWATYDHDAYEEVLRTAKDSGITLYTGAFQKPAPKLGNADAFMNHLDFLEILMAQDLPGRLARFKYMADAFEYLISFPGMGDFTAYQLLLNLSYTSVINFSESDFVVAGLGARSGLRKCFGMTDFSIAEDVMRWMQATQDQHFARLGIKFSGLGEENRPMQLCDIEHTLCEVDKYSRARHRDIKGMYGRTEVGPKFQPAEPLPSTVRLPKAWSHPDRKRVRIRPGKMNKVEKRYVVEKIAGERTVGGELEYLIRWWGYSHEDSTWEPAVAIMEDALQVVEQYLKTHKRHESIRLQ